MDRGPAAYETTYETKTETITATPVVNVSFVRSLSGLLKLAEIVLSCIVLICVSATPVWSWLASGGWVNFVAAITLICAAIFYIFYLFNLIRKLPGPWIIIEFSTLLLSAFFWFIALIVAASNHSQGGGAIAAAVFSAAALAVYVAELATRFRVERRAGGFTITMTGVATAPVHQQSYVTATSGPVMHTAPQGVHDPHIGFAGAYAPGERTDEGYVMP